MNNKSELGLENHDKNQSTSDNFWITICLCQLFISVFAFFDSGIEFAFFLLIWQFGISAIINFLIVKTDNKTILTYSKHNGENNSNEIREVIQDYILKISNDKFIMRKYYINSKRDCLFGLIITLVCTVPILILHPIIILFCIVIPVNVPWIIAYFYFNHRITESLIDKNKSKIVLKKISPTYKILREYNLNEIVRFGYFLSDNWSCNYAVLYEGIDGKKIFVFIGKKEECIVVYKKITDFLSSME